MSASHAAASEGSHGVARLQSVVLLGNSMHIWGCRAQSTVLSWILLHLYALSWQCVKNGSCSTQPSWRSPSGGSPQTIRCNDDSVGCHAGIWVHGSRALLTAPAKWCLNSRPITNLKQSTDMEQRRRPSCKQCGATQCTLNHIRIARGTYRR